MNNIDTLFLSVGVQDQGPQSCQGADPGQPEDDPDHRNLDLERPTDSSVEAGRTAHAGQTSTTSRHTAMLLHNSGRLLVVHQNDSFH